MSSASDTQTHLIFLVIPWDNQGIISTLQLRKLSHQEITYCAQGHLLKGGIKRFSKTVRYLCLSVPDHHAVTSVMVDLGTKQKDGRRGFGQQRLACWGTSPTSHVRKQPRAKCIPGLRTGDTPGETAGKQRHGLRPRKGPRPQRKGRAEWQ